MKTILNIFLLNGFLLLLNSCVPIQELDESYNQMEQTYVTNTNNVNPIGIHYPLETRNPFYYKTTDGGSYLQDEYYRDREGKIYFNGHVIGQDNVFDQPAVIGKSQPRFLPNPMGFLPPVDFDDPLQTNMSREGNSTPTKRSGSNSNTYPGSFNQSTRK
ncbi:hypothetical protein L0B70_02115 [Kaistella sp. 97-N-M2]|uniref:hypothetical protein n=1 Tax=Kaistella sp. 97-N-M2 TaxID=2908645 RepID=UPI001F1CCB11|nr:hypothetical protein [Kaistella sp. 97-N-M2]UJF30215.1 hypothetical protein L0B70_02115 [Kaistella sp. 97-N-M2]